MLVCNASGEVLELNRKAQRFYKAEATTPISIFESFTGPTAAALRQLLELRQPQCQTFPAVSFLPSGALRMVVDLSVARLDREHWLLTLKDATRRWRMESHVHRLLTALDATPDVLFLTDSEYRITYVNAAFQSVTGYSIQDALGQKAELLRAPASREKVREYMAAVEEGRDWAGELLNRRRDGSEYPVESSIAPICDGQGKLIGFMACEREAGKPLSRAPDDMVEAAG